MPAMSLGGSIGQFLDPSTGLGTPARTVNQFAAALVTAAGTSSIWTPATGKKFRLMGYAFLVDSNATLAVAGALFMQLFDGGTALGTGTFAGQKFDCFVPAVAGPIGPPLLYVVVNYPGNGYLSLAANNSLRLTLNNALVTGFAQAICWGTEE